LPLLATQFPLKQFTPAQFRPGLAFSFRWRCAARQQLRVAVFQVLREFIDDGRLARRL